LKSVPAHVTPKNVMHWQEIHKDSKKLMTQRKNPRRDYEDITNCDIKRKKQELVTNCDRLDRLKPELSDGEFENLKSQFVISSWGGMRRANLYAFLKT
jgi:hypothetical protein